MKAGMWSKIKKTLQILPVVAILLFAAGPARAAANEDAPRNILDARAGVFRIVVFADDWGAVGTGFAVGTPQDYYIITNHHVVEDGDEILVYYNTGEYVMAEVVYEDLSRDLCALKAQGVIPGVKVLPLQTEGVDSGIAVYALGFPAVADEAAGDWELYWSGEEEMVADKQSMTLTSGNINSVRSSRFVGDETAIVATVQTDARLSSGNSGGPLLGRSGGVVGVNTQISLLAPGIGIAVHVEELAAFLQDANIKFTQADSSDAVAATSSEVKPPQSTPSVPFWQSEQARIGVAAIIIGMLVLLVTVLLMLRNWRAVPGGKNSLLEFEKGNKKLEEYALFEMVRALLIELIPLAMKGDITSLLTPLNVQIGEDKIFLRKNEIQYPPPPIVIYSGYSAPEHYARQSSNATVVYFIGALMLTLLTGHTPPEATHRKPNEPLLAPGRSMHTIINHAMETNPALRTQDIRTLLDEMNKAAEQVSWESSNC